MRLIICFLSVIMFSACKQQTPEEKAKKLIKDRLFTTLHDFKSYEPVKYGTVDSSFTSVFEDPTYMALKSEYDSLKKEVDDNIERGKTYVNYPMIAYMGIKYANTAQKCVDQMIPLGKSMDSLEVVFKPKFNGWKMDHSFRAKSLGGNLGIHHYTYYFNEKLDSLIDAIDNTED
jgi:hypothetical protein